MTMDSNLVGAADHSEYLAGPDSHERQISDGNRLLQGYRLDAQTDMDRIWYASEFRRLEGVTQVVPPQDEFVFHDRLTHSMKVAQVAATIARMLIHRAEDPESEIAVEINNAKLRIRDWVDPDHCYAAGLAHDIGHPPFGHAGEALLQSLNTGDGARSFEGNAQSTRIIASLSFRKQEQPGLNLTLRSLAAIAKYPWLKTKNPYQIAKLRKKWSFYPEESEILDKLESRGFIKVVREPDPDKSEPKRGGESRPTRVKRVYRWPEAEIMDWADDISYAVHDIEDFFRAGRIPLHRVGAGLLRAPREMRTSPSDHESIIGDEVAKWMTTDFEFAREDEEIQAALIFARKKMAQQLDQEGNSIEDMIPQAFLSIILRLLDRVPTNRFDGGSVSYTSLQEFGSNAITLLIEAARLEVINVEGQSRLSLVVDPVAQLIAEFFKSLCQYFVIGTSAVATMQRGQSASLSRLVIALNELSQQWIENDRQDSYIRTVPGRLREYLEICSVKQGGSPLTEHQIAIAVQDYICSLRDIQATILEARLSGDRSSLSMAEGWLDV